MWSHPANRVRTPTTMGKAMKKPSRVYTLESNKLLTNTEASIGTLIERKYSHHNGEYTSILAEGYFEIAVVVQGDGREDGEEVHCEMRRRERNETDRSRSMNN